MPKQPLTMGRKRRTPYVDPFLERKHFRPKPVPLPEGGERTPTKQELVEQYLDARIGFAADLAGDPPAKRRFQDRTGQLFEHAYGGLPLRRGFSGRSEARPPARADFAGLDFEDDPLPPPEELAPPRPPKPPRPLGPPPTRASGLEPRPDFGRGPFLRKQPGESKPVRQPGASLLAKGPERTTPIQAQDPSPLDQDARTNGGGPKQRLQDPGARQVARQWPLPELNIDSSPSQTQFGSPPVYAGETAFVVSIPPPTYREDVFASPQAQQDWQDLDQLLTNPPVPQGVHLGPAFRRSVLEFFAAEGGWQGDDEVFAGIRVSTLENFTNALNGDPLWGPVVQAWPSTPDQLTMEQWVQFLAAYHAEGTGDPWTLRLVPGQIGALSRIGNYDAAAALFDVFVTHGGSARIEAIQRAINRFPAQRDLIPVEVDGDMGPKTFDAFVFLANNPTIAGRLLDELADERLALVLNNHDIPYNQLCGWYERINHFRFRDWELTEPSCEQWRQGRR